MKYLEVKEYISYSNTNHNKLQQLLDKIIDIFYYINQQISKETALELLQQCIDVIKMEPFYEKQLFIALGKQLLEFFDALLVSKLEQNDYFYQEEKKIDTQNNKHYEAELYYVNSKEFILHYVIKLYDEQQKELIQPNQILICDKTTSLQELYCFIHRCQISFFFNLFLIYF